MRYSTRSTELYHHGVKGQKWGVRRYQKKDGSLTPAGKKRYNESDDTPKQSESDENKPKSRKMSKGAKTAIVIGASAVAAGLLAYGTYRLHKSGKLDSIIDSGKNKLNTLLNRNGDQRVNGVGAMQWSKRRPADGLSKIKKLSHAESISEAISKTNPTGSHNNCYNCVVATVARMCGLDVTANRDSMAGRGMRFDNLCRLMGLDPDNETQVRRVMNPTVDKIANVIGKRYKEGDCGAIGLSWNDDYLKKTGASVGGHTLNWILKNGKVEFMDGQVGITGERLTNFMSNFMDSGKEVSIAKFANVTEGMTISADILGRFAN